VKIQKGCVVVTQVKLAYHSFHSIATNIFYKAAFKHLIFVYCSAFNHNPFLLNYFLAICFKVTTGNEMYNLKQDSAITKQQSPNHERDRELFRRISESDAVAFTEFFNYYSARLAIYVSKFLKSDNWAEEIVQDVFMRLWSTRENIRDLEYPVSYLYTMAANRTKDYLAKKGREIKLQHFLEHTTSNSNNYTQEELDYRISAQLFARAIRELPERRADIFRMRHEQGLSYSEIAEQLNLSKNTVRNHLTQATQDIRDFLLRHGDIAPSVFFIIYFLKN
jgi:RNA polymerase sigma-70 factor (family 1)